MYDLSSLDSEADYTGLNGHSYGTLLKAPRSKLIIYRMNAK